MTENTDQITVSLPNRVAVEELLEKLVAQWIGEDGPPSITSRFHINSGPCSEFAADAVMLIREQLGLKARVLSSDSLLEGIGMEACDYHEVIQVEHLYYDAQMTGGTPDPFSIPLMKKIRNGTA